MPNVFIFHGRNATPESDWYPWLKEELEDIGCSVFTPTFPIGKAATLENWFEVFKRFEKHVDKDSILIGHSVGATFVLDLLEKLDERVKSTFLVSCFITKPISYGTGVNELGTFYEKKFVWEKIKRNCEYIYMINSNNDRGVSLDMVEKISKPLDIAITVIEGAGHFRKEDGFSQFPQLLDMIEDTLTDL
ncbi:MAG: alpha/beta hydrolase [Candidatus Marsarchaeota archaeon]|nr:alpha/beta hydrolase [Candidatus Marsarchaeota archaeon]